MTVSLIKKFFLADIVVHTYKFSLTRDWSKRVALLNMPQLKMGNIRVIFPNFQTAQVVKKA